jgi:hypothetical protein
VRRLSKRKNASSLLARQQSALDYLQALVGDEFRAAEQYQDVTASPAVIGHYRLRPPQKTTTVRVENDQVIKTEGPLADTRENFRALYLIESDDHDAVLDLAARIPAARRAGAVEVWPLTER